MLSLSLASPGGCQAVGAKMRAGTKRGSASSSFSETQHRAAVGVSFGVRTRSVRHPRLAMGGEGGRAISRTQGTFASGNGGAVAPLSDGDAEGGSQEGQAEKNVDGAMETSPSRWHPCWADKWLKVPDGGFCQVPWNGVVVAQVMILWFASFLLVGHVGLPSAVRWLGFNCQELSARGLALYSLSADVVEMFVGLFVLFQCLRPYFPLPERWFPATLRGGWIKEIMLGCALFPIVSTLNNLNSNMMPIPSNTLPVSPWEQSLMSNDLVSILFYVAVVSLVAPIWEEMIFRGFLLPSFTRYFRVDVAVLLSSLIFALAHFSMERLIPLTFLGMLMCVVYIRSRNILAPIILHSLWNAFAFVELIWKPGALFTWLLDFVL